MLIGVESSTVGKYSITLTGKVNAIELAQVPVTFYANGIMHGTTTLSGTDGATIDVSHEIGIFGNKYNTIKLYFGQAGFEIEKITIKLDEELKGTIWG